MLQNLMAWLLSLAATRPDNKGKVGTLKIYSDAQKVGKGLNCISFDRLVRHCKVEPAVMTAAIGALLPTAGTGARIHVVVTTPERLDADKRDAKNLRLALRDANIQARFTYLSAAGRMSAITVDRLPDFVPDVQEEVSDEATVN